MSTTSFTFNNELFTTTLYAAAKEIVDQLDYSCPLVAETERIHGKGKPSIDGGNRITMALNFSEHSNTTELSDGYEEIDLNVTEIGVPGIDDWMDAIRPVVISGHEKRINSGSQHKLLDITQERGKATAAGFRRQYHKRLWGLAGSGLTDLNSVNGADATDGFLEIAAVGSQTNTVHGINKTTYQTSMGWQNQRYDGANDFSANGLIGLDAIMIQIASRREVPTDKGIWYASLAGFGALKQAVRTYERYVDTETLDAGVLALRYNGYRVLANRDMPNAGSSSTADPWSFVFLDHTAIRPLVNGNNYFRTGEFVEQSGYDVTAAPIHLMLQWVTDYLGTSGVLFDAETY